MRLAREVLYEFGNCFEPQRHRDTEVIGDSLVHCHTDRGRESESIVAMSFLTVICYTRSLLTFRSVPGRSPEPGGSMKFSFVGFLLLCAVWSPLTAQSKNDQYQTGKVLSVDNRPMRQSVDPNPPLASNVENHDAEIQVGDTIYAVRFQTAQDQDLSWLRDTDLQVTRNAASKHSPAKRPNPSSR